VSKHIIHIEKELTKEDEKRIKTNLRKINNGLIDLKEMGYDMYLSPNSLNVCDGETHTGQNCNPDRDVVVASIYVTGVDAGDW